MKEASGELNMTVITLVAVAAIGALFYFVLWPLIQRTLVTQSWKTSYGSDYTAQASDKDEDDQDTGNSNTKVHKWECCPAGVDFGGEGCIPTE